MTSSARTAKRRDSQMRTDEKITKICDSLKVLGCGNASEKIQDAITNGLDDVFAP